MFRVLSRNATVSWKNIRSINYTERRAGAQPTQRVGLAPARDYHDPCHRGDYHTCLDATAWQFIDNGAFEPWVCPTLPPTFLPQKLYRQ